MIALMMLSLLQDQPPPKVKKIVLYKHGVGYFEREGSVTGDATVSLSFKSNQMKDLLKSLYAVDLDGGRIGAIMYDSKDPLSKQLENVMIQVPNGNALTEFLSRLKGAEIEAKVGPETVAGQIVGIEPISKREGDAVTTAYKLVVYQADGSLRPFDLFEASTLTLKSEELQKDLKRVLDIYGRAQHADQKQVTIQSRGDGAHRVRIGYIVETPIWKTSYRVLFDESGAPLVQGWGIVENTTDEDWEEVEVTFVAGAPMSFVMDLYTAYYPVRPHVGVISAVDATPEDDRYADAAGEGRRARAEKMDKDMERAFEPPAPKASALAEQSVVAATTGAALGDLFTYVSKEKVTIGRGRAALVPILSERLKGGERALHWRPGRANPTNAFLLDNTTELTLETGPVTFFDGSTCVGEGLMHRVLKKGMHDLISYAVDTSVRVESAPTSQTGPVTKAKLVNGLLTLTYGATQETKYTVTVESADEHTLYLDHPVTAGYDLKSAKPHEEVDGHYRYKLALKRGKNELVVNEWRSLQTVVQILQTPADTIRAYLRQPYLSEAAKKFLEDVVKTLAALDEQRSRAARLEAERRQIGEDETRVRANLQILKDNAEERPLRAKALEKLTACEARLEEIGGETADCVKQQGDLTAELRKKVEAFKEE